MPDIYGRRLLGDGGRLPALWWEDGPLDVKTWECKACGEEFEVGTGRNHRRECPERPSNRTEPERPGGVCG